MGQTGVDGVDTPLHAVIFRVAFPGIDPAARLDQIVKAALFAPAAGVDPNRADAQIMGQIDAVDRVVDMLLTFFGALPDKILVDAQIVDVETQVEGVALEFLKVAALFTGQLTLKDFNPMQAQAVGRIQDSFDRGFFWEEVPVGVG